MNLKSLTRKDIKQLADSSEVFHRGEEYYEKGAIYKFSAAENVITAKLHGSYGDYTVKIEDFPGGLEANCSCPYERDVCKHVVAVLLQYVEGGHGKLESVDAGVPGALEQALKWQNYIDVIRKRYPRHRALQDEFREL